MHLLKNFILPALFISCIYVQAQPSIKTNKKNGGYTFDITKQVGCTPVKNQNKSGTCWCFSTQSFLESELMRMGKGQMHLSEMFVVHNMYIQKAENYIRYQGARQFAAGGEAHDVINAVREYGIVPYDAYPGMPAGVTKPAHGEMDAALKGMLDAMVKVPDGKLSANWEAAFIGALNGYMGAPPESFTYQGKTYTPKSFAKYLGIDPDDYVEITSVTHHPFYSKFIMEVSDNWSNDYVSNVSMDDMKRIVDNALANNYSVAWGSDVSEKGFSFKNGIAIVPDKDYDDMTQMEKDSMFNAPMPEKAITQQLRQEGIENLSTTDDHGMHIVGTATDQKGNNYYLVENSWGTMRNDLDGYFYCSMPFFLYKTTSFTVNKHAIPKDIATKMGIKM